MSGLLSRSPSPAAVRRCVAATLLLLTHVALVLLAPAITGAVKLLSSILRLAALAADGGAVFGHWPVGSTIPGPRDDA